MINETVPNKGITNLADQLLDVVNGLLEIAGDSSSIQQERPGHAQPFRAEMRRFHANGEFVDLSDIEARILEALLQDKGKLVSKVHLCQVLDLDPERQERNLKSYVYRLRSKLSRLSQPGVTIRPIHGAGYVLSEASENRSAIYAG